MDNLIKLNELAESGINLTDLIAKSDTNGSMTKTNIQKLVNFIGSVSTSGMKEAILTTSEAPTENGLFPCAESGTYTNFGGEVVNIIGQVVFISVSENQTVFEQVVIPLGINFDSLPTSGSINAVESKGIKSYVDASISNVVYNPLDGSKQKNAFTDTYGKKEVNSNGIFAATFRPFEKSNELIRVSNNEIPTNIGFENKLIFNSEYSSKYAPIISYRITPEDLKNIGIDVLNDDYDDSNPQKISIRTGWLKDYTSNGVRNIQLFVSILYDVDPLSLNTYYLDGENAVINSFFGNPFYGGIVDNNLDKNFNAESTSFQAPTNGDVRNFNSLPLYKNVNSDLSGTTQKTFSGLYISILAKDTDITQLERKITTFGFAVANAEDYPTVDINTNLVNNGEQIATPPFKISDAEDIDVSGIEDENVLGWDVTTQKFIAKEINSIDSIVNIQNSDKIAFYGCSFTQSYYAVKNKSWVNKLAQMTDYICANFGVSGNRLIDESKRLLQNSNPYHATIGIKELNPTYISFANIGNETLHSADSNNLDLYVSQMIEAIQSAYSVGATPIMGTDHYITNQAIDSALFALAEEYNTLYHSIGTNGEKIVKVNGVPAFWGGSHPATRTNAHQFLEWLYFISKLPKPNKSIKIFRNRADYKSGNPTVNELNYDNISQRSKFWQEISSGETSLKEADAQFGWEYYDRLDENFSADNIENEYCKLINKENVSFDNFGLFEFIIDKVNPNGVELYFKSNDEGINFSIKDNNNSSYYKDNTRNHSAFKVEKSVYDSFNENIDELFNATIYESLDLKYKGKEKSEALGGYYLFFTFGSGVSMSGGSGVLTKKVGGQTYNYEMSSYSLGRYSFDFFSTVGKSQMIFTTLNSTYQNGYHKINLNNIDSKYLDFDKIKIIAKSDSSFSISDVYAKISGGTEKVLIQKDIKPKLNGTELNTVTSFGSDWVTSNNWVNDNATLDQMPEGLRDYPTVTSSLNHITLDWDENMFPNKILKTFNYNNNRAYTKLVVKVVSRLFPKVYNTTVAEDDYHTIERQITSDSYDMGTLCLGVKVGNIDIPAVLRKPVDIGWSEVTFETYLPPYLSEFDLSLWRDEADFIDVNYKNHNHKMQIFDVSVQVL